VHFLIGSRGFKPGDDRSRVDAYQHRWRMPLDMLALVTLWLIVVPPGVITADHGLYVVLVGVRIGLSAVYAVDLTIRARLAPHHWYYVVHNPLSVATIFLPFLRVVFSIQLLRSVFQRGNLDKFALAAVLLFLNLTVVVYFFERHAPHGNIKTLGNALWWAVVTLTTVGYGDFYPVTPQGRVAAALLMFVGFAVLATITAQISSAFIDQAARTRAQKSAAVPTASGGDDATLQSIADRLTGIESELQRQDRSSPGTQGAS
jgi:voltage-gated potassium channel